MLINGGAAVTYNPNVQLTLSANDGQGARPQGYAPQQR